MNLAIGLVGFVLMVIGVIGYSFTPPPDYVGREEKILTSIALYYTIFALMIFVNALWNLLNVYRNLLETFELMFMLILLVISSYGVVTVKRVWRFELIRLRDALIYGSVVHLMNKSLCTTFGCVFDMDTIAFVLSAWIAAMSVYVIVRFRRLRFFLAFERFELVSIAFLTTFFLGLCAVNGFEETLPYILIIVLTAYALYVIISEFVKPIFETPKV